MFRNLGLFSQSQCPDLSCTRPTCFFAHGSTSQLPPTPRSIKRKVPVASGSTPEKKVRLESFRDGNKAEGKVTEKISETEKVEKIEQVVKPAKAVVPAPARPTPKAPILSSSSSTQINTSKPPSLPTTIKNSPQPYADRQKALQTLFTQYQKLYRQIISQAPELAHQSTLKQESEISSTSSNIRIYKNAIHQAAVSISRRPAPTSVTHPSIGTVRESRIAHEAAEKASKGRLLRSRIDRYCLPVPDFPIWRYPDPNDEKLWTDVDSDLNAEGQDKVCSRCKVPFIVSSNNLENRFGECKFHHGKTAPERVEGKRKWIYSCCRRERGEAGCEEGIHVFTDGEDDGLLAKRCGFKSVAQLSQAGPGAQEVVGMDCEMIYTTAGLSLARATIVDENGEILLDELVRQKVPILDLSTRFSGITEGQLDSAAMDLAAVRAAACMFIGPETILVGHGLENDLRALRLLHDKVIDTAILIPHDRGPPYRRALRDIVKEKLGYFIQDRTGDLGHSSAVDAIATLEVLKWKVRDDSDIV